MTKQDSNLAKLNPEPTDVQRATWRRHHKKGTSPGNPKWYRAATLPKPREFKPGRAPVYPKLPTGGDYHTKNSLCRKDPFELLPKECSTADYVAAYDKAAGLKAAR